MTQASQQARDQRARELSRMPKRDLAAMCAAGVQRPDGGRTIVEGAHPVASWTKDEIIATVLGIEYPALPAHAISGTAAHEFPCPGCGKMPGERGRGWRLPHPDESGTGNGVRRCEACNPA